MKKWIGFVLLMFLCSTAIFAQDSSDAIWQPVPGTTWQLQLSGEISTAWDVAMYDIDLFDVPLATFDRLHADGRVVICYFSAGSWEDWRDDAGDFPDVVLGNPLEGWAGERWLDIRRIDLLTSAMTARFDLAVKRGCDGVDPDNVNGYANNTGFDLTEEDQIAYNIWLSEQAHARGLSIGLKNDLEQIDALVGYFDWALNEECFQFGECQNLLLFIEANKAVFGVEYTGDPAVYCPQAAALGFSWLTKTLDLGDEPPGACLGDTAAAVHPFTGITTRSDGAMQLTEPPSGASDQNPAFAPGGDRMLFTRFHHGYNHGPADLMLLSADGQTEPLVTTPDSDNVNMPGTSWNGVIGRIAFSSDREDTDEIWTTNADGSVPFRVTDTADDFALEPTFSPDGEWIVFEVDSAGLFGEQIGTIWKIRVDGSDLMPLTLGVDYDDHQPNWSPSGERILFQRRAFDSDNWDIYTIAPDGSDLRQVTTQPSGDTDASWSPDARWIVYSSDFGQIEFANLFIISADGGEPVRLTFSESGYDGAPSWSPDGAWVAFESGEDESPTALWMIAVPDRPQ